MADRAARGVRPESRISKFISTRVSIAGSVRLPGTVLLDLISYCRTLCLCHSDNTGSDGSITAFEEKSLILEKATTAWRSLG